MTSSAPKRRVRRRISSTGGTAREAMGRTGEGACRAVTSGELRLRENDLEWRQVGDEVVALDLSSSTYVSLHAVGAAVWPLLAEGTTWEALVGKVTGEFDVDVGTAERDLRAFVDDLESRGLLAA